MSVRMAIYIRVSTPDQARDGFSLDHQLAACRGRVDQEESGVEAGVWSDVETGRNEDRAGYRALLAAHRSWDVLVVWRCDRLGRDAAELFGVARDLRRAGKRLISCTENVDDPFVMGLHFLLAQRESWLLGERVRPVMRKLAAEGRYLSRPPLGYRMVDGRLVVDPASAAFYLEAVEAVEAGHSPGAVTAEWNRRGVPAYRGGQWDHSTLRRLLRNPVHAGLVRWPGLATLVPGQHEALISRERWEALQARLGARALRPARPHADRETWLLSGFGHCACGAALTSHTSRSRGVIYRYYACRGRRHGRRCDLVGLLPEAQMVHLVEWVLTPLLERDASGLARWAAGRLAAERARADPARERERRRLAAEIARYDERLRRLVDDLADRVLSRDEYHEARARASTTRERLVAALAALPAAAPDPVDLPGTARLLRTLGDRWRLGTTAERRELLRLVGLQLKRQVDGVWVRVDPAWSTWTRGDTFFPFAGGRRRRDGLPGALAIPDEGSAV